MANGIFQDEYVGLNVSEPLPLGANYYPEPTYRYLGTNGNGNNFPLTDAYVDRSTAAQTALDHPLDVTKGIIPNSTVPSPSDYDDGAGDTGSTAEPALGTIPRFCSVFLQRLADPLSAYNATDNPYVTVDWMSLDLTVFSEKIRIVKLYKTAAILGGHVSETDS